jgi:peroxin-6
MYALCSDAMLKAITRQARAVDEKVKAYNATQESPISIAYYFDHWATEEDTAVMVTEDDFVEANRELVPSVSADELGHYERVRKTFEGTGKKEEQKPNVELSMANGQDASSFQNQGSLKGKGKGKADTSSQSYVDAAVAQQNDGDNNDYVIRTEHLDLNGSAENNSGKGKGKAASVPGPGKRKGKNSVDIAEGGFGDGAQDEDLYE